MMMMHIRVRYAICVDAARHSMFLCRRRRKKIHEIQRNPFSVGPCWLRMARVVLLFWAQAIACRPAAQPAECPATILRPQIDSPRRIFPHHMEWDVAIAISETQPFNQSKSRPGQMSAGFSKYHLMRFCFPSPSNQGRRKVRAVSVFAVTGAQEPTVKHNESKSSADDGMLFMRTRRSLSAHAWQPKFSPADFQAAQHTRLMH